MNQNYVSQQSVTSVGESDDVTLSQPTKKISWLHITNERKKCKLLLWEILL